MTARDRIVVIVLGVVAILAAFWIMVVSPERQKADKLGAQVSSAQSQLNTAEADLASARSAQAQYAVAYASIVSLGKAVPADQEVPSLIYELEQASNGKHVEFASITTGTTASSTTTAAPTAAVAAAGFTQMPFTFVFNGTFFDLEHLFGQLNHFTLRTSAGALQVSGRLLTVQSVKLAPVAAGGAGGHGSTPNELTGTITATAYVLPPGQGLTGPSGSASAGSVASLASATGAPSSPTAPAIARVTP
jgi:Tfp pilus assembly protein PilO